MKTKTKEALRRGLNLDAFTNAFLPRMEDRAIDRVELEDQESEVQRNSATETRRIPKAPTKPPKNPLAVQVKCNCDCRESGIVRLVPIEYLEGDQLTLVEVPITAGSRTSHLMRLLEGRIHNLRNLELWTYPRQSGPLCQDAPVFELVVQQEQQLQLRQKRGFWERIRQRHHDGPGSQVTNTGGCSCL